MFLNMGINLMVSLMMPIMEVFFLYIHTPSGNLEARFGN